jgi:hypothetical protein
MALKADLRRAIAQAVCRQLLTVEARVCYRSVHVGFMA